jgi:RNA polymerase sigma-70 factor, ECF subfamily
MCLEEARMNPGKQPIAVDEEQLTKQAMNGDLDAFNQLVLRYQDVAYSYSYAVLKDPDQAEDVAQESFIKAFQAMNGFRGGSFRSWLLKIVTNSAYDTLRRSRRHPTQPLQPKDENGEEMESPAWLADPGSSVQEIVEQNELSKSIYTALDTLPDVYRTVITLIDLYEFDYTEAAAILKVPLGTIKSRLARARLQIQEELSGNLEHTGSFVVANAACAS